MSTFMNIVGGAVIFTTCAAILVLGYLVACAATKSVFEKYTWKIYSAARGDIVSRFLNDSWWFSEDKKTMRALQLYGKALAEDGRDISRIREEWRREFSEKKP